MAIYEKARDDLDMNAPIWAHKINALLKEKNMTQEELAKASGISKGTITLWFRGKKIKGKEKREEAKPKIETLRLVANTLGVSVEYLYGLYEIRSDDEKDKICSEWLGLDDEAIKLLHYLKWLKADKDLDMPEPQKTLKLINCVLKDYSFWQRFQQLLFEYARGINGNMTIQEAVKKGLWKDVKQLHDTDKTRYLLNQMFEKLKDDCKDSLYPFNLSKTILEIIEEEKAMLEILGGEPEF